MSGAAGRTAEVSEATGLSEAAGKLKVDVEEEPEKLAGVIDGRRSRPAGGAGNGATSHNAPAPADEHPPTLRPAQPPLTPAEDAHRKALRRSVLLEVIVSVIVLVLTTVLTGTLPGRAQAEAASSPTTTDTAVQTASVTEVPFTVDAPGVKAQGKVQLTLDPGRAGPNSLQAVVYAADGGFSTVPELRVSFSLDSQDIGPLDAKLVDRGGYWAADTVNLPIPGEWTMRVTVRVTEIDQVSVERKVNITR